MLGSEPLTTDVSTKGQVILPKAIRSHLGWEAGTRLIVEETQDGVLLKPAPVFPRTRPEEVFQSLPDHGRPKTIDEMDAAIEAEVKHRHARGRY